MEFQYMDIDYKRSKKKLIRDCNRLLFTFAMLLVFMQVFSNRAAKHNVTMKNADTVAVYNRSSVHSTFGILSALEPGESLQVWYQFSSCFGGKGYKLDIIRKGNSFVAELFQWEKTLKQSLLNIYWPGHFMQSARLDTSALIAFREFEANWPKFKSGGCSSSRIISYTIRSNYMNTELTDGSCENYDFDKLLKKIFHN
ncbi:hypothetical protein [Pseudoflavitalea rhizosphaerae]|uniref:hypothetical protein n=1 Tax=Pseudoflavitalea rhizosphaerae TaxID=1884793 RepID=UPI000F8EFDA7|nr:hypothetical protein [Pseudoflavitalea rhizosphaerae]